MALEYGARWEARDAEPERPGAPEATDLLRGETADRVHELEDHGVQSLVAAPERRLRNQAPLLGRSALA